MAVIITNKRAKFDYTILESYQAGLSLPSRLVKLIRSKKIVLEGKYIIPQKGQLVLLDFGNEEIRENIPLLLNKKEIAEITEKLETKGISCIPLNIKTVGRWLKSEIALVKGKKAKDKRRTIKDRDLDRDMGREISQRYS
jgi:SsrA-binding protein